MKIAVIEGSPHKNGSSNTLANEFIRGARENGHTVTVLDAAHMNMHPCIGCEHCGMDGECVHKDDNHVIRETLLESDMAVFVTPIYYFGVSAQLKMVIDRFYSYTMPYSPLAAGHLTRPTWTSDSLRSATDRVAMGKYDRMEEQDMRIVKRLQELSEKHGCKMSQIALAWQWAKGVTSPIVGATKAQYLDDAAGALEVSLTPEEIAYLEEPYVPHPIVGAIKENPADGVMLLDEKK